MAAGAWQVYTKFFEYQGDNTIDMDGDTFICALLFSSYTPNVQLHTVLADVVADECDNTDYARVTLTTIVWDATNLTLTFDADDISFGTSVDITAKYAVIFDDTPVTPTDPLVCYSDLDTGGGSVSSTNGSFQVTINASGIFTMAQA
jgi:hypothetical protein